MSVKDIQSLEEFLDEVHQLGTAVVKISTSTCGPCVMMAPIFEKASEGDYGYSVNFLSLSPENDSLISDYVRTELKVSSVPTFVVFKDGAVTTQFSGAVPLEPFKKKLGL